MRKLDNTMVSNFNRCERYYFLRHVRNLVSLEPPSMAPLFGIAIHKGGEYWDRSERKDDVGAIKAFAEEYVKWFDEKDDERTPTAGMEILRAYFERWRNDYLRTLVIGGVPQIEVGFGIVLDLWGEEVNLIGKIDRMVEWETSSGVEPCILDRKTTYYINSSFTILKPNSQFTTYIYGAREITGLPIRTCFVDLIGTKIRKQVKEGGKVRKLEVGDPLRVEIARDQTEREEEDFEEWKYGIWSTVRRMKECEKTGRWPMRTHSCPSFRGCEYIPVCQKSSEVAKEGMIRTLYREEEWKPWEEVS